MPVIKSAKKKLRQDVKRRVQNLGVKNSLKAFVKTAKTEKTATSVSAAFKAADKAAKLKVIHKNKAARIKSTLSKLLSGKTAKKEEVPAKKTPSKKTAKNSTKKAAK